MTRDKLWRKFAERNPSFDGDGSVTLSARGLRKLFAQTWDFAYEAGVDDSKFDELMRNLGMKK
jgi:hypothetical protein